MADPRQVGAHAHCLQHMISSLQCPRALVTNVLYRQKLHVFPPTNSDMRYLGRVLISHLSCTLDIKTINYSAVEVNKMFPITLKE